MSRRALVAAGLAVAVLAAAAAAFVRPRPPTPAELERAARDEIARLFHEKRWTEAEEALRKLIGREPPVADRPALGLRIGEAREGAGDLEAAREAYREVAGRWKDAADPPGADEVAGEAAFRAAATVEELAARGARALADALEAWESFARDFAKSKRAPEALLRLGKLYRRIAERGRAIAAFRKLADDYPGAPEAAEALREIGVIYGEELDEPREAAKAFKELEEKHPDRPAAAGARALRERAEREAAREEEEAYRDEHYGGRTADISDLIPPTPREMLAEMIAMRLDIRHIEADVRVAPAPERAFAVTATVEIAHGGEAARRDLLLVFDGAFEIERAAFGGAPAEATHDGMQLHLKLASDWPPGEARALRLEYRSRAEAPFEEERFGIGTSGWIPASVVGDTFTGSTRWRVPEGTSVVATGDLVRPFDSALPRSARGRVAQGERDAGGEREFAFSTGDLPVFGLYFAYGRFRSIEGAWRGRPISVHWLDPGFDRAGEMLEHLRAILDFYSDRFGEPPWPRYSIVEAGVESMGAAGVGPAGMVLLFKPAFAARGGRVEGGGGPIGPIRIRNLLAHELAHQWWGNLVPPTLAEGWAPWLSEGLATYSDALFLEHVEGREAARRHLAKFAHLYYELVLHARDAAIADAWWSSPIYRAVAYEKAARVLHLLRRTIGDEAFFAGMRGYATEYRFRESTTDALRGCFERASGRDLAPFFDDWVKRPGFPRLVLAGVTATAAPAAPAARGVSVALEIEQRGEPRFRLPWLPVRFEGPGGAAETRIVQLAGREREALSVTLPFSPVRAVLDPDDDVLKHPGRENEWPAPPR